MFCLYDFLKYAGTTVWKHLNYRTQKKHKTLNYETLKTQTSELYKMITIFVRIIIRKKHQGGGGAETIFRQSIKEPEPEQNES